MASLGKKLKKLTRNKLCLLIMIGFFSFLCVLGIKSTLAYYQTYESIRILANVIGDFDIGDGDVNGVIYKESDDGIYVRSYTVPALGYVFNDSLTSCTISCSKTDPSANCYYTYNSTNKEFTITSNKKVTCKFYFTKESESDIKIFIMKEDAYNSQTYTAVDNIPAYGYVYSSGTCDNDYTNIAYNSITKTFSVSTSVKNVCYAYFDAESDSDITVNTYVENLDGEYVSVDSIPTGNIYKLSTSQTSKCYDSSNNPLATEIQYIDGYINILAEQKQTCYVYLDLDDN